MKPANFNRVHGQWRIQIAAGGLLLVWVSGSWNREAVELFGQEYRELIRSHGNKGDWVVLYLAQEWGMASMDAEPEIQALHRWAVDQGEMGAVFVMPGDFRRSQLVQLLQPHTPHYRLGLVDTCEAALEWLSENGHPLNPGELERFLSSLPRERVVNPG